MKIRKYVFITEIPPNKEIGEGELWYDKIENKYYLHLSNGYYKDLLENKVINIYGTTSSESILISKTGNYFIFTEEIPNSLIIEIIRESGVKETMVMKSLETINKLKLENTENLLIENIVVKFISNEIEILNKGFQYIHNLTGCYEEINRYEIFDNIVYNKDKKLMGDN